MKIRSFLWGMAISTVLCWLAWVLVLFYIDPTASGFIGPAIFYLTLFFGLVGTFTIIGFFLRVWRSHNEVVYSHVGPAFRQALLFGVAFVGVLILQSLRYLTWWSLLLFVAAVIILELFFLTQPQRTDQ
jgi:hypothetical protein